MSLLQCNIAPQIREFLNFLGPEDIDAIAKVASNNRIHPTNTDEAIDVILLHTSDVARLFSYKCIKSQSLFMYLHKHAVPVNPGAKKNQLIVAVHQYWTNQAEKNTRDLPVAKRRASDPSSHHSRVTEIDNRALTCETSAIRRKVSHPNRSYSESEHTTISSENGRWGNQPQTPLYNGFNKEGAAHPAVMRSDQFTAQFCDWYYTMVNRLQPECAHQLGDMFRENVFFNNSSVDVFLIGGVTEENHSLGAKECFTLLCDVFRKHRILFSPNMESGTQALKTSHGMVKIFCCGTLFQADMFIGIFEQEFGVMMCPMDRTWKIMYTKLNLKQASTKIIPSLPSCEIFEIGN